MVIRGPGVCAEPCKAAAQACNFFTPKSELDLDLGWRFYLEAKWGPKRGENPMETSEPWRPSAPRPLLSGAQAHPGYELVELWGPARYSSLHPVRMGAEVHAGSPGAAPLTTSITGATCSSGLSNRFRSILGGPISIATSWGQCRPRVQDAIHPTVCTAVFATGARAGEASSPGA